MGSLRQLGARNDHGLPGELRRSTLREEVGQKTIRARSRKGEIQLKLVAGPKAGMLVCKELELAIDDEEMKRLFVHGLEVRHGFARLRVAHQELECRGHARS